MKDLIFITQGVSNSGKDTTASILNSLLADGCINIKFTEIWKRFFEKILQIPEYSLDNKEYRKKNVINTITGEECDYTYNDFMYRLYHHNKQIIPGGWLFAGERYHYVKDLKGNKCFTDVRNECEIDIINRLKDNHLIVLLNITGRGEVKSTDNNINYNNIKYAHNYYIDNSRDKNQLRDELFDMLVDLEIERDLSIIKTKVN